MRLRKQDLPENARKELEKILSTSPESLTTAQHAFLKARRGYLSSDEETDFAEVLGGKIEPLDAPQVAAVEAMREEKEPKKAREEEDEVRQISKDDYKRSTLMQMAKDAGLPVENTDTKQDLEDKLNAYFRGE